MEFIAYLNKDMQILKYLNLYGSHGKIQSTTAHDTLN